MSRNTILSLNTPHSPVFTLIYFQMEYSENRVQLFKFYVVSRVYTKNIIIPVTTVTKQNLSKISEVFYFTFQESSLVLINMSSWNLGIIPSFKSSSKQQSFHNICKRSKYIFTSSISFRNYEQNSLIIPFPPLSSTPFSVKPSEAQELSHYESL